MNEILIFNYKFSFEDGSVKEFPVKLKRKDLSIILEEKDYPDWTKMEYFRCPHCPLINYTHCPLAQSLAEVIYFFGETSSFEKVDLTVQTDVRNYHKKTSLQSGLSSLVGVLMVTSGCPIMGKLKPLVRYHQPYASLEETEFRVFSMYLLAQFLILKKGGPPDWEMKNLSKIYEEIGIVNVNVCRKIADLESKDSSINSVIALNNLAEYISFNLDEERLEEIENLFKNYFEQPN